MARRRPTGEGVWQTRDVRTTYEKAASSAWKRSPRAMVTLAACVYVAVSVALVVVWGSELDADAVFPGVESPSGEVTRSFGPTPTNPPDSVLYALAAMSVVVAVPIVFRGRLFLAALSVSTFLVTIALVATALRLGIFLTPVLILQVFALVRTRRQRERLFEPAENDGDGAARPPTYPAK